jgi:YrbI family 3-deoxy-D-manno-octulosonate 8-phosphate phosphatase
VKKDILLIAYDFDGVLTDNRVWVFPDGSESVVCNRSDGLWIREIKNVLKIEQLVISTEENVIVSVRCKKLNLECFQGVENKLSKLKAICSIRGIDLSNVCYVGNDINDLECMKSVGFAVAPQDANPSVKEIAVYVTPSIGGAGIVRDVYDWIRCASAS